MVNRAEKSRFTKNTAVREGFFYRLAFGGFSFVIGHYVVLNFFLIKPSIPGFLLEGFNS